MIRYEDRWALVTGASSGFGRHFALRLAERGMSLVLTGLNVERLEEVRLEILGATLVKVETIIADLSTPDGVAAVIDQVRDRDIEVLINNAGFGTFGPFAEADPAHESDEVAVDVSAVVDLARAVLPGMLSRGSGGILNVASTIAFQPGPNQAVYGASKAFVLSFSQALWAESRAAGVAVTALCPGPTRTGFVDALGDGVGNAAIYRHLADPEPVVAAGLRALDRGRPVVTPGVRNKLLAFGGRFMPRSWLTRFSGRLLRPDRHRRPPVEIRNEIEMDASPERVWDILADVEHWPSWYQACRWIDIESTATAATAGTSTGDAFRWKAHPVVLRSTVSTADRGRSFVYAARARGLKAEHSFTFTPTRDGTGTLVVSHETQTGLLPWLGRLVLAPKVLKDDRAWLEDLAAAAVNIDPRVAARPVTPEPVTRRSPR